MREIARARVTGGEEQGRVGGMVGERGKARGERVEGRACCIPGGWAVEQRESGREGGSEERTGTRTRARRERSEEGMEKGMLGERVEGKACCRKGESNRGRQVRWCIRGEWVGRGYTGATDERSGGIFHQAFIGIPSSSVQLRLLISLPFAQWRRRTQTPRPLRLPEAQRSLLPRRSRSEPMHASRKLVRGNTRRLPRTCRT